MSDSAAIHPHDDVVRSVTYDQLVEHLEKAEARRPCDACGKNEWFIMMDSEAKAPALLQLDNARNITQAYWHFGTACSACGNMRLYHANFVALSIKRSLSGAK